MVELKPLIRPQHHSMSQSKFEQLAKDAGATYKLNKLVLVNREVFDDYLESFRI